MTDDQTERLEVAGKIMGIMGFHYSKILKEWADEDGYKKRGTYEDLNKLLSRRDSLMKKRGAVEELSKMERIVGKDLWSYQLKARVAVGKEIMKRIEELEREIKEMEARK